MRPLRIAFGAVALAGTTLVAAPHAFSQSSHSQSGASSDSSSQQ